MTYLVSTHGHLNILTRDGIVLVMSDMLDIVAGQLEDVGRDILQHSHNVQSNLRQRML